MVQATRRTTENKIWDLIHVTDESFISIQDVSKHFGDVRAVRDLQALLLLDKADFGLRIRNTVILTAPLAGACNN